MKLSIRITGAAGLGMNSTADIVGEVFADLGYDIITEIEYQSIIKWGFNHMDVYVSDDGQKSLTRTPDILIALDEKNLERNIGDLKQWGAIIANQKSIEKVRAKTPLPSFALPSVALTGGLPEPHPLDSYQIIALDIQDKYENTYLIAALAQLLDLPSDIIEHRIKKIFLRKGTEVVEKNLEIFRRIYSGNPPVKGGCWSEAEAGGFISEYQKTPQPPLTGGLQPWLPLTGGLPESRAKSKSPQIHSIGQARPTSYGNRMLALGAIDAGLEYYSAYPMTPSSTILAEIIKSKKVTFLQAEDEIAVVMSALGASYTGARSMVGTSGGGFALMVEGISFAAQAEIPLVMVLSQRAGPSTGTPTFHEAGELTFALHPSFGEFEHIVLVPSTLESGYHLAGYALNLAQKYQCIVIILSDKQFAEGKSTIGELQRVEIDRGRLLDSPEKDFKRYELTDDGISPYVRVWTPDGDFIATSYEHDEYGATTEASEMKKLMTEKRMKKLENFYEKEGITGYEIHNPGAKKLLITTSFTTYTALDWISMHPEYGLVVIHILKPLDDRLRNDFIWAEELIFLECNYSGQLEKYLTDAFWLRYVEGLKISHIRKYDLYPFYREDLDTLLTE